jgi:methyl-accepting chemotaxis protein
MSILSRLRLRTKFGLLLGLFTLGLIIAMGVQAFTLQQRILDDRIDKLKAAVDMSVAVAALLESRIAAHEMTRDGALARLRDIVHAMRFDGGDGYGTLQSREGVTLIHGIDPNREGKPATAKDANGGTILNLIHATLRDSDSGTVAYLFPKPGQAQPLPKVSYVARFAPWNGVFLARAYTDDLERDFRAQITASVVLGLAILLVTLAICWLVNRDISGSVTRLKAAMTVLAQGDVATDIPGTKRADEIGEMAAAERRSAEDKKRAMARLASEFESSVGAVVNTVASAAVEMETASSSMKATADQTERQVAAVAAASQQVSANVQSVASATEEMSSSVAEISRQVAASSAMASKAVSESERTNLLVNGLADAAQKIGAVTNMINEIASQTNLLALNATIAAARAGEAGKGCAVVASEVKNLANQTAKATEEISEHIGAMQSATGDTVAAIQSIGEIIGHLKEVVTTIAAAVEEQGAATEEIARSVQQASVGTTEVSSNIGGVAQVMGETGTAASKVFGTAGDLSRQAEKLRRQVAGFLAEVRAA